MADLRALFCSLLAAVFALVGFQVIQSKPVGPTPPPATAPAPKPETKPDAAAAIARIQFGPYGCSATVIGPRRTDGKYWVLTAAHCIESVGQRGTMRMLDGRTMGVVVRNFDRKADACWLETETNTDTLPFALLADSDPAVGSRVWHAGYGVDVPGNREAGLVIATSNTDGQVQFRISVSSGDSGGGICLDESGRVVSTVCCTTAKGQVADVWGAGPAAIRRTLPTAMVLDDWKPIEVPLKMQTAPPSEK